MWMLQTVLMLFFFLTFEHIYCLGLLWFFNYFLLAVLLWQLAD